MIDRSDSRDFVVPSEFSALDAELSSIHYEERPSFAPELEAELLREWRTVRSERHWPVRQLVAAGIVGLFLGGLGVPSARAALVRLADLMRTPVQESPVPATQPVVPALHAEVPSTVDAEPVKPTPPRVTPPEGAIPESTRQGSEVTFPELRDRAKIEKAIRDNYPMDLQTHGIGGTVRLLLWVDSLGAVDVANVGKASGVPELDRAAVQVAPSFEFVPARRYGKAVGTWVEFDVRFRPRWSGEEGSGIPNGSATNRPRPPDLQVTDPGGHVPS